jgi:hypothetical protein
VKAAGEVPPAQLLVVVDRLRDHAALTKSPFQNHVVRARKQIIVHAGMVKAT